MNVTDSITIHIISHNHWDREWIFTSEYTNRWLVPFFDNLFKMLREKPRYRFVLDGQTLMIEDYLSQLPEEEARAKEKEIRRYVEEGRLMVGPSYLQPDWTLVSGEALVRNLMIGHRMAERLGGVMKVGWLLDNFGQIAQAPQIHRGFGIDGVFLWRGPGMDPDELKSEFWWESPDGSKVLAIYLLNTYRNAMALAQIREIAVDRVISQARKLRPFASTPNVLLMNGYEQDPGPDDVLPIIEEVNREVRCVQGLPSEYLEAIRSFNPELPILRGYLYSGRYMPILTGVFSSRMHLKQRNADCQGELERWAEPFSTLAWALGAEYPRARIEKAWKMLLLNHPHDSICGCSIDDVCRNMIARFDGSYKLANEVTEESLRTIAQAIDTSRVRDSTAIVMFNPSCWKRRGVMGLSCEVPPGPFSIRDGKGKPMPYQLVEREGDEAKLYLLADRVPPLGYKTYYLVSEVGEVGPYPKVTASDEDKTLENDHLKLKINEDGSLTFTDKGTGHVYERLGYFEDGGDAGDTYDYSYPLRDRIITSLGEKARITLEESGPLVARFRVEITLRLPKGLSEDREERSEETVEYPIVSWVELAAGSPRVEIKIIVDNVVKDHRLRVLFPTSLETDCSHAEEPFDIARFPIEPEPCPKEIPERLRGLVIAGRNTVPVATRPFRNFVDLTDGERGLAVISRGLTEYEILEEKSTIALTLLRAVGWLARDDLLTREGDIGPQMLTPEAQCLGRHAFHYSIYPHRGDWFEGKAHLQAETHNLELRAVQTPSHPGKLPDQLCFLSVASDPPDALRMTAVKISEEGNDLIIRLYNTLDQGAKGELRTWVKVKGASRTSLNEEEERELPVEDGVVKVEARGKEIITIRVKFDRQRLIRERPSESTKVLPPLRPEEGRPGIEPRPAITEEDIRKEERRARELEAEVQKLKGKVHLLEGEIEREARKDIPKMAQLQRIKCEVASLSRQLLETRLSVLLSRKRYVELNEKDPKRRKEEVRRIEEEIEGMGEEMCWIRIEKRVGEYLSSFYESLLRPALP
ncbi:MAG: glycoside hydrolase family 38 C-terminal domain-containing protein [Candidatus Bipolaricaulia bacterium]